jgi:hypothetical protein
MSDKPQQPQKSEESQKFGGSGPYGDETVENLTVMDRLVVKPNYQTPAEGGTVDLSDMSVHILAPTAALTALTLTFPASPTNGRKLCIVCTHDVAGITLTNATISGTAPTSLTANTPLHYTFYNGTWYNI